MSAIPDPAQHAVVVTSDPAQPAAVVNETDRTPLEIALGYDQPLPWPNSLSEEIALAERKLAEPILDRLPAYRGEGEADRAADVRRWESEIAADPSVDRPPGVRKAADVDRVLRILDSLEERRAG